MTDPSPRRISSSNELAQTIVSVIDSYGNPIGSGFIVAGSGLVLTAAHVIHECRATAGDVVKIGFVGRGRVFELEARVDEHHFFPQIGLDTAVLRPLSPLHGFCAGLELGDSGDLFGRTLTSYGFPTNRTGGIGAAISGVSYVRAAAARLRGVAGARFTDPQRGARRASHGGGALARGSTRRAMRPTRPTGRPTGKSTTRSRG